MLFLLPPTLSQQAETSAEFLAQAKTFAKAAAWTSLEALGRRWIVAQPNEMRAHLVLGHALRAQDRRIEALEAFRRASEHWPEQPLPWFWCAVLEASLGHRQPFMEINERLGRLDPEAQVALWSLPGIFAFAAEADAPSTRDPKELKLLKDPGPTPFPDSDVAHRLRGRVVLEVFIDAQGVPTRVRPLAGPPVLAAAAARHATSWRFYPPPFGASRVMSVVPFGVPLEDLAGGMDYKLGTSPLDLKRLWGHEEGLK